MEQRSRDVLKIDWKPIMLFPEEMDLVLHPVETLG
jgi:hypothetical protein